MEKISDEEFESLPPFRKGSSTRFFTELMDLSVGDKPLILLKSEWKVSYAPTAIVNRIEKKYNRKYQRKLLKGKAGWVFRRVK